WAGGTARTVARASECRRAAHSDWGGVGVSGMPYQRHSVYQRAGDPRRRGAAGAGPDRTAVAAAHSLERAVGHHGVGDAACAGHRADDGVVERVSLASTRAGTPAV